MNWLKLRFENTPNSQDFDGFLAYNHEFVQFDAMQSCLSSLALLHAGVEFFNFLVARIFRVEILVTDVM